MDKKDFKEFADMLFKQCAYAIKKVKPGSTEFETTWEMMKVLKDYISYDDEE